MSDSDARVANAHPTLSRQSERTLRSTSRQGMEPHPEQRGPVGARSAPSRWPHDELDRQIRQHHAEGDCDAAATLIIRGYGAWVNGFIASRIRAPVAVDEVYSLFCEQLWRGLPSVRWRSSVRGWVFALARNAMCQHLSSSRRFGARHVPLPEEPALLEQHDVPPSTRIEAASGEELLQRLRAELSDEDARMLAMRASLALSWEQIARSLLEASGATSEASVRREAVRLRKRYQLVKERLIRRAREISSQP